MTSRERLRRCYFNETLDRPGVYSRAGFPGSDPSYDRLKAYLRAHTELKHGWSGRAFEALYPADSRSAPHTEDFDRRITTLHTPGGDLESTTLVSRKGLPGMDETFFVKCREDAERYLSLPMPEVSGDVTSFFRADAAMGEQGIVDVGLGLNPAGFVAALCGSETFAIMSLTDREVLHLLCRRQMEIVLNAAKFLLSRGVGPFFSMLGQEYIVPPLHGPADFRDFNVRYDRPVLDLVHEAGGRVHIHCHASVKKVLRDFVEMGTDVLHPFEAPPMGDITPAEAKSIARGKMCLEGNLQIARMYEQDPDGIREETEALIEAAFDDQRGLIVSPTASPYIRGQGEVCFEQYRAMIDAVLSWDR